MDSQTITGRGHVPSKAALTPIGRDSVQRIAELFAEASRSLPTGDASDICTIKSDGGIAQSTASPTAESGTASHTEHEVLQTLVGGEINSSSAGIPKVGRGRVTVKPADDWIDAPKGRYPSEYVLKFARPVTPDSRSARFCGDWRAPEDGRGQNIGEITARQLTTRGDVPISPEFLTPIHETGTSGRWLLMPYRVPARGDQNVSDAIVSDAEVAHAEAQLRVSLEGRGFGTNLSVENIGFTNEGVAQMIDYGLIDWEAFPHPFSSP